MSIQKGIVQLKNHQRKHFTWNTSIKLKVTFHLFLWRSGRLKEFDSVEIEKVLASREQKFKPLITDAPKVYACAHYARKMVLMILDVCKLSTPLSYIMNLTLADCEVCLSLFSMPIHTWINRFIGSVTSLWSIMSACWSVVWLFGLLFEVMVGCSVLHNFLRAGSLTSMLLS